jgi:rSAM/selenodomain-associated transferase 1
MRPLRTLVIMVKDPVAGRVKTRLARGIGCIPATAFYRHAVAGLAARLAVPRRWTTLLAVAPDAAVGSRALRSRLEKIPQGRGDLGQRMQRVFDRLPTGPVVIIGSDVPGISQSDIASAFRRLEGHDAVLGPSPDGGYWLIGLGRRRRRLEPFPGVRWSTDEALAGTLRNLAGCRVSLLSSKADIDDAADWQRARAIRGRRILAPGLT